MFPPAEVEAARLRVLKRRIRRRLIARLTKAAAMRWQSEDFVRDYGELILLMTLLAVLAMVLI
jgi:hypothetical protein